MLDGISNKRVALYLASQRQVTRQHVAHALKAKEIYPYPLCANLVRLGYLDESLLLATSTDLVECEALTEGIPDRLPNRLLHLLPRDIIVRERILPLELRGNELTVAMLPPPEPKQLDRIARYLGYRIKAVCLPDENFRILARRAYSLELPSILPDGTLNAVREQIAARLSEDEEITIESIDSSTDTSALQDIDELEIPDNVSGTPIPQEVDDSEEKEEAWFKQAQKELAHDSEEHSVVIPPPEDFEVGLPDATHEDEREEGQADRKPPETVEGELVLELEEENASEEPQGDDGESTPDDFAVFAETLAKSMDRNTIIEAALDYFATLTSRSLFLTLRKDEAIGFMQRNPNPDQAQATDLKLDLTLVSLTQSAIDNLQPYIGPPYDDDGIAGLTRSWGGEPPNKVCFIPVHLKEKPVGAIYCDDVGSAKFELDHDIVKSAQKAVNDAFQTLILSRKLGV